MTMFLNTMLNYYENLAMGFMHLNFGYSVLGGDALLFSTVLYTFSKYFERLVVTFVQMDFSDVLSFLYCDIILM